MKFHEWESIYSRNVYWPKSSPEEWYNKVLSGIAKSELSDRQRAIDAGVATSERQWYREMRPYYKVFPAIVPALLKVSLDLEINLPERVLAIRFPENREPKSGPYRLMAVLTAALYGYFAFHAQYVNAAGDLILNAGTWRIDDRHTLADGFAIGCKDGPCDETPIMQDAARVSLMCHLLADDPSIITPDVLAKDRDRYDQETDEAWKQRAIDRARRRGVVGWNIGADYEVCPHYRRPHFGLRHTGKGKTVPRIVPIKGAVVHRSRLTEVPTGWMTQDGREVEPNKPS